MQFYWDDRVAAVVWVVLDNHVSVSIPSQMTGTAETTTGVYGNQALANLQSRPILALLLCCA